MHVFNNYCAGNNPTEQEEEVAVQTVRINPQGMVVNQDARVGASKSGSDTITWSAQGTGGPWTVIFLSPSPFSTGTFIVPAGGSVSSGPINSGAALGKARYEVRDSFNNITDDPDIIIES